MSDNGTGEEREMNERVGEGGVSEWMGGRRKKETERSKVAENRERAFANP